MANNLTEEQKVFLAKAAGKVVSDFMKKHPEGVSRRDVVNYFVELQDRSYSYAYLGHDMKSLYQTASQRLSHFGKQKNVKVEKRIGISGRECLHYSFKDESKDESKNDPLDGMIATFGKNKYRLTRIY